jgi:hypothetical protein
MTVHRGLARFLPHRGGANAGGNGPRRTGLALQDRGATPDGSVPQDGGSRPVSLDVANPVNLRIEAEQGAGAPKAVQPAELQKVLQIVGTEARKLAKSLRGGVRLWPGALLSFFGVAQLIAAFLVEALADTTLGTIEFVTSSAVGLAMAVAGSLVITHNVNKSEELAQATLTSAAADKKMASFQGDS